MINEFCEASLYYTGGLRILVTEEIETQINAR